MDKNKKVNMQNQFKTEQYYDQSNLAYLSSMVLSAIMTLLFYFEIESNVAALFNLIAVVVSGISVWLNRNRKYSLSAFIFIGYISTIAAVQGVMFGLSVGFQYYLFNMAGLIMYSSWKIWQKLVGLIMAFALFNIMFMLAYNQEPLVFMNDRMVLFFHTINMVLNIIGVSNSAYYFIGIATKSHNRVMQLAMRDYLTNLMNRTAFDDFVTETFKTRNKNEQSLAILLLDIDHFKHVNDTWGHLCGDEILRQFAVILTTHVRSGDFVARYGGEEFVIVATMETPEQLKVLAERLRREVEAHDFMFGGDVKKITVSIGAVYIPSDMAIDQHQAIDKSDKLLYQAKSEGRNRVALEVLKF